MTSTRKSRGLAGKAEPAAGSLDASDRDAGPYPPPGGQDSFFMGPSRGYPPMYGSGGSLSPRLSWAQVPSGINVILGVWLLLSPMLLYPNLTRDVSPAWNDMVAGAVLALLAIVRVVSPRGSATLSWLIAALGAWLIASPFVLSTTLDSYPTAALWNEILTGLAVLGFAVWSGLLGRRDRRDGTDQHPASSSETAGSAG